MACCSLRVERRNSKLVVVVGVGVMAVLVENMVSLRGQSLSLVLFSRIGIKAALVGMWGSSTTDSLIRRSLFIPAANRPQFHLPSPARGQIWRSHVGSNRQHARQCKQQIHARRGHSPHRTGSSSKRKPFNRTCTAAKNSGAGRDGRPRMVGLVRCLSQPCKWVTVEIMDL